MTSQEIETRIKSEYRKHKDLDWAKIAAKKIYSSVNYALLENYNIGRNMGIKETKTLKEQNRLLMELCDSIGDQCDSLKNQNEQ